MRRHLIAIAIVFLVLLAGSESSQVNAQQPSPATAASQSGGSIPIHCQAATHSARIFAGSIGVAIGFEDGGALKACLLVRVPAAKAQS